jgi:hypothetical protein
MLAIDVRAEIASTIRDLNSFRSDQLPFATALALTRTAQDARDEVRRSMPSRFTVRRDWIAKGVVVDQATKTNLTAIVRDRDPFMALQETGGEKASIGKRVFDYGEYLAIPLDARKNKRDIVDKRDWPQNLIDPFVLTARDGRKYLAVHSINVSNRTQAVRTARGKQRRTTGTRLMYVLVRREELQARFGFRATVEKVARDRINPNFIASMDSAIASARR